MKKLLLFLCIALSLSCKYDVEKPAGNPIITVNTPIKNQHFKTGDVIHITGTVTNTRDLAEVAVHMTNTVIDDEFYHNHKLVDHKLTYDFDATYTIVETMTTLFKIEIEAEDVDFNQSSKEIIISIN